MRWNADVFILASQVARARWRGGVQDSYLASQIAGFRWASSSAAWERKGSPFTVATVRRRALGCSCTWDAGVFVSD